MSPDEDTLLNNVVSKEREIKSRVQLQLSREQEKEKMDSFLSTLNHREDRTSDRHIERLGRSRFNDLPGSIHSKSVDFQRGTSVFGPQHISKRAQQAKADVFRMRQSHRLGVRKAWNSSVSTDEPPCVRPLQRQLSVYQSEKLDIDYRASHVPDFYKRTVFVPQTNKFEVDKEPFLSNRDKKKAIRENIRINDEMIRFTQEQRRPWNASTEINESELEKSAQELTTTIRAIRKPHVKKHLKNYISPIQREIQKQEQIREQKRLSRATKTSGDFPQTLTESRS